MLLETGAAAALFVATFLAGGRMHPLRLFTANRRRRISSLFVTSLFFCKKTQAAAFLRKSSGNAISLRHNDAAMICFPRLVTLHLRVRGIVAINFVCMKAVQDSADLRFAS